MKKFTIIIILIIASTSASVGQDIDAVKLDSFLNVLAAKDMAMGSLAISQNGVIKYQKGIGNSSTTSEKRILADVNTKYRIGSVTKMFTAVMIFQLMEERKIMPDQPLSKYFPDLPNADKITIQNMLSHRSGLPDYTRDTDFFNWMDKPKSREELLRIISEKGSDFEPGTKADYCNSNYLLLGYIIEMVCKMPYADALKKRIAGKLNLNNTQFGSGINTSENSSYKYANNNWNKEKQTDLSIHGGAGAIISTPTDMVRFIDALFAYKLIRKSSLDKMRAMVDDYGMGMFSNKYSTHASVGHNGRIEEFYSALWYFPNEKLAFAYCTNGIVYPRVDIIEGILKICFKEPFPIPFTQSKSLKSEDLNRYLGQYSSDQIVVNCTKDGNKLLLETRGTVFEVERISDNYFMNAENGYFFEFYPDQGELHIKETDNIYILERAR